MTEENPSSNNLAALVNQALDKLRLINGRRIMKEVLKLRYDFTSTEYHHCYTQGEVGRIYKLTPGRIGQIEKEGLDALKKDPELQQALGYSENDTPQTMVAKIQDVFGCSKKPKFELGEIKLG